MLIVGWEKRLSAAFVVVAFLLGTVSAEPPSSERIDQIAAMLGPEPSGLGHPCDDRDRWASLAGQKDFKELIADAARLVEEPMPELPDDLFLDYSRTGNRKRWESVAFARRGRIRTLVLAECSENQGRFLPAIEATIRALCAEKTWVYPAHDSGLRNFKEKQIDIDLGSSYVAAELGLTDYLLASKLIPEVRELVRARVRKLVLEPFRDMVMGRRDANWWLAGTNNWNSVCLAGVTIAALSLEPERADRAFFIAAAEQYSKNFLGGFTPDGYCSEGLSYWNYGFGRYAMLSAAIERATRGGVDLLSAEGAILPAKFGGRVEIVGGVYPTFADCPMSTRPDRDLMRYLESRSRSSESVGPDAASMSTRGGLMQVLAYLPSDNLKHTPVLADRAGAADDGPLRTWFPNAGVLICRPTKGAEGLFGVAIKGGHNAEHHNHNDVGTFIVVAGDRPVLADPGTEVYTARTFSSRRYDSKVLNSFGHPVPVVAGKLQRTGRQAQGRVQRQEFNELRDTIALDLSSAYDVPDLKRLEREFCFDRVGGIRLTVTDSVEFSSPESFEVALITHGSWKQLAADTLRIDSDGHAVDVRIEVEGAAFELGSERIDEDVRTPIKPTRIAVRLDKPVQRARIRMTIAPATPLDNP